MVILILTLPFFFVGIRGCSTVLKEREAWEFVKALGTVLPSKFLEFRKLPHLTDVSSQLSSHFLFFLDPVSRVVHEGESSCCQVVPCLFSAFPFCTLSYAMLWPVDIFLFGAFLRNLEFHPSATRETEVWRANHHELIKTPALRDVSLRKICRNSARAISRIGREPRAHNLQSSLPFVTQPCEYYRPNPEYTMRSSVASSQRVLESEKSTSSHGICRFDRASARKFWFLLLRLLEIFAKFWDAESSCIFTRISGCEHQQASLYSVRNAPCVNND